MSYQWCNGDDSNFFFFILVYFSAHSFIIVNILRQLKHDAGGFSYKSTWTLQELFPLIILVVNVKLNTHKKYRTTIRFRIRKFGSQKGVLRLPFRHHSHQEKRLRDEE